MTTRRGCGAPLFARFRGPEGPKPAMVSVYPSGHDFGIDVVLRTKVERVDDAGGMRDRAIYADVALPLADGYGVAAVIRSTSPEALFALADACKDAAYLLQDDRAKETDIAPPTPLDLARSAS